MLLGILRNSINLAKSPTNLLRTSQVLSQHGSPSKSACQQCNDIVVSNNWSIVNPNYFGTFRTLVSFSGWRKPKSTGLCEKPNAPFSLSEWENSMITAGGPFSMQVRGMKFKAKAKRRCKDCFLQWINGMLYNLCKTHPRHKHGMKPPYYSNQRILTHATQSPKRPW